MPTFRLTAMVNMPLNKGMKIEKGWTFDVELPFNALPFNSLDSKARVIKALDRAGFEPDLFKNHESFISGSFFSYKKM